MAIKVAVVTDALSDQYFFPIWRKYYGEMFGDSNLFVVTYAGGTGFAGPSLGGVLRMPVGYDDATRANVMSDLVATLLGAYDVVIRVDADEILMVDPSVAPSLREFIESSSRPYHTARGFDVIQTLDEPAMAPGPLLAQRRFAYPAGALNKTCIVRVPVHWTQGFHWCSVYPDFGPLFMLHLKRIDIDWQVEWFTRMTANIGDNPNVEQIFKEYYRPDREKIVAYHRNISNWKIQAGIESWYRHDHQSKFIRSVSYNASKDVYSGTYEHDHVLCEIPQEWKTAL